MTVSGVLRRQQEVLLLCQRGVGDPSPCWALPGGRAEAGETLFETLAREVKEETGLEVLSLGPLLYLLQIQYEPDAPTGLAFVFEVAAWKGEIRRGLEPAILDVAFCPVSEAIRRLEEHLPYPRMREPIVAHLRGEVAAGAVWLYRRYSDGRDEFRSCTMAPPAWRPPSSRA